MEFVVRTDTVSFLGAWVDGAATEKLVLHFRTDVKASILWAREAPVCDELRDDLCTACHGESSGMMGFRNGRERKSWDWTGRG